MTTRPTARHPNRNELRALPPLRDLPDADLEAVAKRAEILRLPRGARIRQSGERRTHRLFLVRGELRLMQADGSPLTLRGGHGASQPALLPETGGAMNGVCAAESELLRIPLEILENTQAKDTTEAERLEDRIFLEFHFALNSGKVELPGMPDVAVRIARHIETPESTSESIARIVQTDPSVTARLIQVANSPAFGGLARIESCKEAVTRLGRRTTRDLVTGFVLRGLFHSRAELVRSHMRALWRHSTHVAVLCHALARRCPGFDPAEALLMGLVHDIGVIPLLTNAHRYPGLAENDALLERIVARLRSDFSAMTLRKWGFATEFVDAAREAENWLRDRQPEADYTDILIMAQLHAYVGTPRMAELPRLDQVPAFHKLALGGLSPRMSLAVLDEAQQEIEELQEMFA